MLFIIAVSLFIQFFFVHLHAKPKYVRIMTGTVLRKPSAKAAPYWGMLQGLSKPLKLELVVLLSESMEEREVAPTPPPPPLSEEEKDRLFEKLAGCWADDPEDAARMEATIKVCRENDVLREVIMD